MTQRPNYSIIDLGVLLGYDESRAIALNDKGQVVGTVHRGDFDIKPYGFLWHDGKMSGSGDVIPYDINGRNQIVGTSRKNYIEFIAHTNKLNASPKHNMIYWEQAINENGQVVGFSQFTNWRVPSKSKRTPFILDSGERRSLISPEGYDFGEAKGINSQGMVVGSVRRQARPHISFLGDDHAVVWQDDAVTLIGEPNGFQESQAVAANDRGQILVKAYNSNLVELFEQAAGNGSLDELAEKVSKIPTDAWDFKQQPYLWHRGQWQVIDGMNLAHALNNQGQVVGSVWIDPETALEPNEYAGNHAAFWEAGDVMDLNDVLPKNAGWVLQKAMDINNYGQIAGYGKHDGKSRAFLLTPEHL